MSNANLIQTNFTSGELSPKLLGRYDVERYKNGVSELKNFLPLIQGGIKSTPMRRYNATAKNAGKACRIIRFEFSSTEANILEFGENYIRFFNQDRTQVETSPGVPYEISTVYAESELFEIEYVGGADTIFLFHQDHPVQRLRRFDNDNWVIEDAPFNPQPFFEQGFRPSETLTLSSASAGSGRTFTAGGSTFLEADVGRRITYLGGIALITGYTSATVVTCTIESAFDSTSISSGLWRINGTPQAVCSPSSNGAVGDSITLELSSGTVYGNEISLESYTYASSVVTYSTPVVHGLSPGNIVRLRGNFPLVHNGIYEVDSVLANTFDVVAGDPGAFTDKGTVQLVTSSSSKNGWRSSDVGSFVEINGGLVEITAYTNAISVTAIVRQAMTSDAESQAGAWTLNQGIWNDTNGYPRCGTFFQQSLVVGGSPAFPHTIAKSRSGEYLNFELGVLDDDAFLYTLDVDEYDPILHLNKVKNQLLVLTSGSEFTLTGGVESPMTPTNVQVTNPSDYGSSTARPVRVESELVFVNRTGLKIRALGYQLTQDSFDSPDLTKLSDHITESGIKDIAYQQEPESIIWMVLNNGTMVTLCIDRKEGILSWAKQQPTTGTTYESVEVIPNDLGVDEVWCVVNTGSNRYIESFDSSQPWGLTSAISASSVTPKSTWSGLDHLEGESVESVADGIIMPAKVVSGGQITIDKDASQVYIGLPSHGYVKTLSPEFFTQGGSAQGNNTRIGNISIQVLETYALLINDQYRDERKFGSGLLDQAVPLFTGIFEVFNQDWQKRGFIEIEQPNALPVHILSIILQLTVNTK